MDPSTIKKSVVRIIGPDGETLGTGFVVLAGGFIATCRHVVEGVESVSVQVQASSEHLPATVRPDLSNPDADVAVLHAGQGAHLSPVRLGRGWSAGQEIWSYGYQYQTIVDSGYPVVGMVSGDTDIGGSRFLVLSRTDVQRGLSGAPLVDRGTGSVIGMIQAKFKDTGLAIPLDDIAARWPSLRRRLSQPARRLRPRVANLFSAMGYRVSTDAQATTGEAGSLVAELNAGPVRLRVVVVSVDSGGGEDVADVERAWRSVGSLLAQQRFDRGFVITSAANGPEIKAMAATQRVELLSVAELERSLIDFTHYLEAVVHDFENFDLSSDNPIIDQFRWCDLYRYYIDLRCVDLLTGRTHDSSRAALAQFLADKDRHHLSILGDYGTGKTSFCLTLTYDLARECLQNPGGARIPLFVPLRNSRDTHLSLSKLILETLASYDVRVADYRAFETMSRAGRFVLFLDGFDELADRLDRREVMEAFEQISELATGDAKIVLTCRTHYFRSEHQSLETLSSEAMTPLMRKLRQRHGFGVIELSKFDEAQILELMSLHTDDYRDRWQYIQTIYNLTDLARTPILLNMILSTLNDLLSLRSDEPINSATLYEVYTGHWLERDDNRSEFPREKRLDFAQSLAWRMYMTDRLSIPNEELRAAAGEFFSGGRDRDTPWFEQMDTHVRTCSFLARDRWGNFMFAHKSFMEFFVASRLAGRVAEWPASDLGTRVFPYEIGDFLMQLVSREDIAAVKAQALDRRNSDVLRGLCMDIVIGLGDTMREEPLVFAMVATPEGRLVAANADCRATVLTAGLEVDRCLPGHEDWVRQVAISPDGTLLATCGWDCRVMLWQAQSLQKLGEVKLPARVNSVCFDETSTLLCCAGYDRAISVLEVPALRVVSTLTGHVDAVNAIIANPRRDMVVSAGLDKTLRIWSLAAPGRPPRIIQREEPITRLAFAPDGRLFASGSWTGEVSVWDADGPRVLWSSRSHVNMIGALGFSCDSAFLASGADDKTTKIWRTSGREPLVTLPGRDFMTAVCFSPSGQRFYCGGYDSCVHMYDVSDWRLLATLDLRAGSATQAEAGGGLSA